MNENSKGWINREIIVRVWMKCAFFTNSTTSLLLWDSAASHITDDIQTAANKYSNLVVIPHGLTTMPQTLDLSFNRPFKLKLRNKLSKWMNSGIN